MAIVKSCWNVLDNAHARKYTDNKCLLHSKPLLKIILPYTIKSCNDGEEQETEDIPIHCIEWTGSSFGRFESQPKLHNTFINSINKLLEQVNTVEKYQIFKVIQKFCNIKCDGNGCAVYDE